MLSPDADGNAGDAVDLEELNNRLILEIYALTESIKEIEMSSKPDKVALVAASNALLNSKRTYAINNGGMGVDGNVYEEHLTEAQQKAAEKANKAYAAAAAAAAAAGGAGPLRICKLAEDFHEKYGDGGGGYVKYPVFYANKLPGVEAKGIRQQLAQQLRTIAQHRMDVQANRIVHDIIDPSLNARMLSMAEMQDFRANQIVIASELASEDNNNNVEAYADHLDTITKRGAFQWVPTLVQCTVDDSNTQKRSACFLGDIVGLPPRQFCPELYDNIELIFSRMLKLLAKLPLCKIDGNRATVYEDEAPHPILDGGNLQVVVKVQKYAIPPSASYTGRWHTEGYSENIIATGVYYLDVSEATTGGNLSFRPPETPSYGYYEGRTTTEAAAGPSEHVGYDFEWWFHYVRDVSVSGGTAVVFSNDTPHRFRTITNDTDDVQERLFINFFIVDPATPLINTTSSCPSQCFLRSVLSQKGVLEPSLQQAILSYSGDGYGLCPINGKLARDQARASMASNRPHWSVLHYGNAGEVTYQHNSLPDCKGYNYFKVGVEYEHSDCNTSTLGSGL
mmetsp:Transcript_9360/g.14460  ORF Transcript_9360/g.14460 Transcript_9360/m.14460 type:complete len:564 (-) Transcript_9360:369-2060(-)